MNNLVWMKWLARLICNYLNWSNRKIVSGVINWRHELISDVKTKNNCY